MSLKDLVEPECGGPNALMSLGNQMTKDVSYQDEGFTRRPFLDNEAALVNEFMDQIAPAPQTFRMNVLLNEMREIDARNFHQKQQILAAPNVIQQVNLDREWATEFALKAGTSPMRSESKLTSTWTHSQFAPIERAVVDQPSHLLWTKDFFEPNITEGLETSTIQHLAEDFADGDKPSDDSRIDNVEVNRKKFKKFVTNTQAAEKRIIEEQFARNRNFWADEFQKYEAGRSDQTDDIVVEDWIKENTEKQKSDEDKLAEVFVKEFEAEKKVEAEQTESYNQHFWDRLQDEWRKISTSEDQHPWLSEFSDYYDTYKEYKFDEENPMIDIEDAFAKGKAFLERDDIPSAVLCFESAVQQDPNNPEIWEYLGLSQAENEKDPNAIAALNKALSFKPNNLKVLMALSISYTNESMQNQALKMLVQWMENNEKYSMLVPPDMLKTEEAIASSFLGGPKLEEVTSMYLHAVRQQPDNIDPEIQEALGVLFSLSSDYDKAADCFRAALQVVPNSSKLWNRLGASLANGDRSVEAVEAYQNALEIQPGFVRARYNVGIICINLKAYKEAAEHLLTALNHQATSIARSGMERSSSITQMSSTIWSTLRMVISLMGKHELQSSIDNRDLDALNREFPMAKEN